MRAPVGVAAGVALLLAVSGGDARQEEGMPNDSSALVVRIGDAVRATGIAVLAPDGRLQLCLDLGFTTDLAEVRPFHCGLRKVYLTGVDLADVQAVAGYEPPAPALAGPVTVRGTFAEGSIEVIAVSAGEPVDPDRFDFPPTPCPTPAGGWPSFDGWYTPGHDLGTALQKYVHARLDRFDGIWFSNPAGGRLYPNAEGGQSPLEIPVIGTTGDVDQAREELAEVFPDSFCVRAVERSRNELRAIHAELLTLIPEGSGQASVSVVFNRVDFDLTVVTPEIATAMLAHGDAVAAYPLVRPDV